MKAVPKLDEGESDLMVLKQVKITYFDVYHIYHKQCGIIQNKLVKLVDAKLPITH